MTEETNKVKLPEYQVIARGLSKMSVSVHASELHGVLSGFICVGAVNLAETYIQELIKDVDIAANEKEIRQIAALLQTVFQQMGTMSFDFHLLLPDDDMPLSDRAKAMSMWCHGFSDGFLQSGVDVAELKTDEARDALYHITEVSQLDYQSLTISEEDEKAFVELYEYVRMAVLMIHTEITQPGTSSSDQSDKTVH